MKTSTVPLPPRLDAATLAAATPASRDRVVDFLRAASIIVVVLGHWLMAVVTLRDGRFEGGNAIEAIPGAWALTWVLQVMPVFFFVGGFSNAVAWEARRRRGEGYGSFLSSRLDRLVRPTVAFALVWLAAALALEAAGVRGIAQGTALVAKPLWFLAVYVLVVAAAPAMLSLHRRYRLAVPIVLAAAAALVDAARIGGGIPVVGVLNFAFVWLFAHQLGFFYADGSLAAAGRRVHAAMAAGGLAALGALVSSGVYSPSMVGVASERASNNSPPSVCLVALSVWLAGLVMLVRPRLTAWLRSPRAWTAVVAANASIMTVFLWHLTALLIVAPVALGLGFPQPEAGSGLWWLTRPVWFVLLAAALAPFVAVLARFERPRTGDRETPGTARALAAAFLVVVAFAGFATWGFAEPATLRAFHAPASTAALMAAVALSSPKQRKVRTACAPCPE